MSSTPTQSSRRAQSQNGRQPLQIWQLNLRHSIVATANITKALSEGTANKTVAFIQEPYLNGNKRICGFPKPLKVYSITEAPRAAIVSLNTDLWFCPSFSGKDVATCLMSTAQGKDVYLASVYLDIKVPELPEELCKLLREKRDNPILVCMDSNSHSPMWGSRDTNPRGENLEISILSNNLSIVNTGTADTFISPVGSSVIDITLCSPDILNLISDWRVNPDPQGSDHLRIEFTLDAFPCRLPKTWDVRNADWDKFRIEIEARSAKWLDAVSPITTSSHLDAQAKSLKKDLNCSLQLSSRWRNGGTGKIQLRWWTPELTDLRREVKHLERQRVRLGPHLREYIKDRKKVYKKKSAGPRGLHGRNSLAT